MTDAIEEELEDDVPDIASTLLPRESWTACFITASSSSSSRTKSTISPIAFDEVLSFAGGHLSTGGLLAIFWPLVDLRILLLLYSDGIGKEPKKS